MSSMFGVIVSGRPVSTEPVPVSETQVAFTLPSVPTINHIVVFLLPGTTLPDGTAAAVYAQLPGSNDFTLLGAIANEKPSAIFKVNNKAGGPAGGGIGGADEDVMVDDDSVLQANGTGAVPNITIGVSIEPAQVVAQNLEARKAAAASAQGAATTGSGTEMVLRAGQNTVTTKVLAQRIIKNAFDYLASFGSEMVPLKEFQRWWDKFEGKIERDPGFLERSDGG